MPSTSKRSNTVTPSLNITRITVHQVAIPTVIASTILAIGASTYHWSLFFILSIGSDVIFSRIYYWLVDTLFITKENVGSFNRQLIGIQIVFWLAVALLIVFLA